MSFRAPRRVETRDETARRDSLGAFESALRRLGTGYLVQPSNDALRMRLRRGDLTAGAFLEQLVVVVYRALLSATPQVLEVRVPVGPAPFAPTLAPDLDACMLAPEVREAALAGLLRGQGDELLVSLYEHLLDRVPAVSLDPVSFSLAADGSAKATARHRSGSFYTPKWLVEEVLASALDPLMDEAEASHPGGEAEALLSLAIVDPSCGTGHFLLGAARRLAARVVKWRAGGTPSDAEVRNALREVIARCLYGVDLDPLAVELCRAVLLNEAGAPEVMPELEMRLRAGDALVGATPALMSHGIPDEAWSPAAGDDVKTARHLRLRNRRHAATADARPGPAASRFLADAWCAAFFWPKPPSEPGRELPDVVRFAPTNEVWQMLCEGARPADGLRRAVDALAARHRFFHWHLAFPEVLGRGGFDLVVGNPPFLDSETMERADGAARRFLKATQPGLEGNWDLFVAFLLRAAGLLAERGTMALVTPSKVLASDYCAGLHRSLLGSSLAQVDDFSALRSFADAAVDVACLTVRRLPTTSASKTTFRRHGLDGVREVVVPQATLRDLPSGYIAYPLSGVRIEWLDARSKLPRLAHVAEVGDGATTAEAYRLLPLVTDAVNHPRRVVRLVNTGTIDPYRLFWGAEPITYLGFRGLRPVIDAATLESVAPRRASQAARAKVVVAGLSRRIEAAVAGPGVLCGKSAMQVLPREGVCPYSLSVILNSSVFGEIYRGLFGLRGLTHGAMAVGARQLEAMPVLPEALLRPAPDQATDVESDELDEAVRTRRPSPVLLSRLGRALHEGDDQRVHARRAAGADALVEALFLEACERPESVAMPG